jgi:hypothetical protein
MAGSVASQAFVGREREIEILLEGLAALGAGRGRLYLLTGEPGIGKTRLADELAARASAAGAVVVWGAAWDGGGAPAYWPWIEVARSLRSLVPEPDERLRRDLGPLWGDTDSPPAGREETESQDPELLAFRRFDALRSVLQAAARDRRLVVILEDLHAADRSSLLALHLVARALRSLPVLIVATHRGEEATRDPGVAELLGRVGREGITLPLGRLGREEVASLIAAVPSASPRLLEQVFEASGGNPLFLAESVRLLGAGGRRSAEPAGVNVLIRERLAQFAPPTREALETAALLGRELNLPVLADACGASAEELRARLRLPLAAGILEEMDDGRVRFAHGLYRERLLADLAPERGAGLHWRLAEALLRWRTAGHVEAEEPLALHLLAAGPAGDPQRAVHWALRAAARARAVLAFDRAVALYEGARAALASSPDRARLIDVELDLAEVLVRVGAGPRSRALCLDAADRARALDDGVRLARAALAYGTELRIGMVDGTLVALLAEALHALSPDQQPLRARVMARLAAAQQPAPDPQAPLQQAREAIELARRCADGDTLLATLYNAGSALADYAAAEERLPLSREVVALALPRDELTIAQQAYARVVVDCLELGALGEAEIAVAAHERLGQALGHARWRWRSPLLRSMLALLAGRWQDAETAQTEAERLIAEAEDAGAALTLLIHRACGLRAREAGTVGELHALENPTVAQIEYSAQILPLLRASTLARLGELASARRALDSLPGGWRALTADPTALSLLCDLVALVGDRERAAQLLPLLAPYEGRNLSFGLFGLCWEGPVAQLEGGLRLVLGQWEAAIPALEEALAVAAAMGARPLAARVGSQLASALFRRNRQGDRTRAQELLERSREEARTLGMDHLVTRMAEVEVADPRPPRLPAAASPPAGEPEAVTLVRDGEVWTIGWAGQEARLKHSRGLEILALLVSNPGRPFHVLSLGAADPGEVIDTGDAGELLDEEARQAYRTRIAELAQELEDANAWADGARRDRLRAEREFLQDELARAVGRGGRPRRAGAAVERARSNVQKRLRAVIRKLAETAPAMAHHLDSEIKTGVYVTYRRQAPFSRSDI